ncbi:uncharacterized protein (DUF302 family) [Silvibacterium bohemicum]|uniref:Uncharacterized protein (DUF302 family) n=1 Tax=Silvibacterium bohemicum TaxID=1577686 RepID=A0A841JWJ4_9BACT|nr:DUF302 domain-containing protein [Silvibacterium bohemicum]MBB6145520.1 uncharacterized protein (DUF302 family) [Silvibacterium bohemicum]
MTQDKIQNEIEEKGLASIPGSHSVDETVAKLENMLREKQVKLFAIIDHSGEARQAGLEMRPTKLLIFGNPRGGTPLMLAAPTTAIDLPLKLLVWEDGEGKVWITYNTPQYLQERHQFPKELLANIAVIEAIAANAAR